MQRLLDHEEALGDSVNLWGDVSLAKAFQRFRSKVGALLELHAKTLAFIERIYAELLLRAWNVWSRWAKHACRHHRLGRSNPNRNPNLELTLIGIIGWAALLSEGRLVGHYHLL